jgi:hypothetical protein
LSEKAHPNNGERLERQALLVELLPLVRVTVQDDFPLDAGMLSDVFEKAV